jgi:excisionase family DNA binding protein
MRRTTKTELMTATETCRYLKITQRTLYRYLQSRQIPAFKLGK